jgi:hypothetical protein
MLVHCAEWHTKRIVARAFTTSQNAVLFALKCGDTLVKVYPDKLSNRFIVDYWFIPTGASTVAS